MNFSFAVNLRAYSTCPVDASWVWNSAHPVDDPLIQDLVNIEWQVIHLRIDWKVSRWSVDILFIKFLSKCNLWRDADIKGLSETRIMDSFAQNVFLFLKNLQSRDDGTLGMFSRMVAKTKRSIPYRQSLKKPPDQAMLPCADSPRYDPGSRVLRRTCYAIRVLPTSCLTNNMRAINMGSKRHLQYHAHKSRVSQTRCIMWETSFAKGI